MTAESYSASLGRANIGSFCKVTVSVKDKLDLSIGVVSAHAFSVLSPSLLISYGCVFIQAVGSSVQIALFVIP